jgi:phosphoribosylanthranilate isomerase
MLTSETNVTEIVAHQQRVGANTIQIVDAVSPDTYAQLHATLPAIKLVQVIHVIDERNIEEALQAVENGADTLLLDSGNPNLSVKELGGTGRVHNWTISRQIVEQASAPVFLAGGLNLENVRRAIDQVQPFGLDICSGVRSNGQLDATKLEAFMNVVYR